MVGLARIPSTVPTTRQLQSYRHLREAMVAPVPDEKTACRSGKDPWRRQLYREAGDNDVLVRRYLVRHVSQREQGAPDYLRSFGGDKKQRRKSLGRPAHGQRVETFCLE